MALDCIYIEIHQIFFFDRIRILYYLRYEIDIKRNLLASLINNHGYQLKN